MPATEKRRTMPGELMAAIHNSQYNSILTVSKSSVISWDATHGNITRVSTYGSAEAFSFGVLTANSMY